MDVMIIVIIYVIGCPLSGYLVKNINESKGYSGGFLFGLLLPLVSVYIVTFKKELPNAKPYAFKVVPLDKVLKKFHYPFVSPKAEPIDILKGNIHAEAEAAEMNLVFLIFHGIFMFAWYGVILSAYLMYISYSPIFWLIKCRLSNSKKTDT